MFCWITATTIPLPIYPSLPSHPMPSLFFFFRPPNCCGAILIPLSPSAIRHPPMMESPRRAALSSPQNSRSHAIPYHTIPSHPPRKPQPSGKLSLLERRMCATGQSLSRINMPSSEDNLLKPSDSTRLAWRGPAQKQNGTQEKKWKMIKLESNLSDFDFSKPHSVLDNLNWA